MNRGRLLAQGIVSSRDLLERFIVGFDDTNRTRQAPNLPNHFAWTLGHLSYIQNRMAERIDKKPIPADQFVEGLRGDSTRFAIESVAFKSEPIDDLAVYPTFDRCVAIWRASIDRISLALERADDAALDSMTPWGAVEVPVWTLGQRMAFHNGTHAGQLIDLRRALGFPRVLV
jgi:hypothetical protein